MRDLSTIAAAAGLDLWTLSPCSGLDGLLAVEAALRRHSCALLDGWSRAGVVRVVSVDVLGEGVVLRLHTASAHSDSVEVHTVTYIACDGMPVLQRSWVPPAACASLACSEASSWWPGIDADIELSDALMRVARAIEVRASVYGAGHRFL